MEFTLLTYNILLNKAITYVPKIVSQYRPDIICLQEVNTDNLNRHFISSLNYHLADYANCFIDFNRIFGVATFYNKDRFKLINTRPIPLTNSLYELISRISQLFKTTGIKRTVLKTIFYDKQLKKRLVVYNTHLSAISLNNLRLKQINTIDFNGIDSNYPLIIAGDFNFPVERKRLEIITRKFNLKEATKTIDYTLEFPHNRQFGNYGLIQFLGTKIIKLFFSDKLKLDYIFYRQLTHLSTQRLNIRISDHYPLIAKFRFR